MSSKDISQEIKTRLQNKSIFFSEQVFNDKPTIIGYDKKFRWQWLATQLNTFIVVSDFGDETVSWHSFDQLFVESFKYAKVNYSGWPRGVQSAMAIIAIAISNQLEDEAITCCTELKARKTWAGFSIPVAIDSSAGSTYSFAKNPMRGVIYYPYFKQLITELTS